jgi:hypothetical protein
MADPKQEESDKFHMMVGYCVSAWASVDEQLFRIFEHCVGPRIQCAIIYYKTPGLEPRFSLTDEIVRSVLPQNKSGQHDHSSVIAWENAIKHRHKLLGTRRRIAHHAVAVRIKYEGLGGGFSGAPFGSVPFSGGGPPHGKISSWVELYMSQHEKARGINANVSPLLIADLKTHYADVGTMADQLLRFFIDVLTKPGAGFSPPTPYRKD